MKQLGAEVYDYERTLKAQNYRCPICVRTFIFDGSDHARRPCIDHDHRNDRFRGILCMTCNRALGMLGDSIDGLERAIEYLRQSKLIQREIISRSRDY